MDDQVPVPGPHQFSIAYQIQAANLQIEKEKILPYYSKSDRHTFVESLEFKKSPIKSRKNLKEKKPEKIESPWSVKRKQAAEKLERVFQIMKEIDDWVDTIYLNDRLNKEGLSSRRDVLYHQLAKYEKKPYLESRIESKKMSIPIGSLMCWRIVNQA